MLLVGISILGCEQKKAQQPPEILQTQGIRVKTLQIKEQQADIHLQYSGFTKPVTTTPLSFQLPGAVVNIYVEEGDQVRKGQLLAELDKTTQQSSYAAAIATQQQAQDAFNRMKTVYDNGSLPDIKWEEMKSKLEQANASVQIAKQNLNNSRILSPSTGIIGSRNLEVGANATPGVTVFTLVSIQDVYASVSVPENEINKIGRGQMAQITFPALGEKVFEGVAEKIGVVANPISKTYEVKFRINNRNQAIKPGMVCNITIALQQNISGQLIPIQSIMKDAYNTSYVFVVDQQTRSVQRRDVQTGEIINNQLNVLAGVQAGDLLVIEGQQKLSDNAKVTYY